MQLRLFRNSVFALLAAGLALIPIAVSASSVSISAGPGALTGRVALTIPITASCSGTFWDPSTQELFDEFGVVNVEQASGQQIARGSATFNASLPGPLLFQCDGNSVTFPVTVLADPSGPPFHGGTAVVTGFLNLNAGTNCGFPGCYFNIVGLSSSLGPQQIKVH